MLNVAQQIDRRAHFLFDEITRFLGHVCLPEHLLIIRSNSEPRAAVISKIDHVIFGAFELLDINFRRNENWLLRRVTTAGKRIEGANELQLGSQCFQIHPDLLRQMGKLVLLQFLQMISDQLVRQSLRLAARFQLNQQAFAHVSGPAANRLQFHHYLPRFFDSFFGPAALQGNLFVGRVQPSLFIQVSDHGLCRSADFSLAAIHVELPFEMIGQ